MDDIVGGVPPAPGLPAHPVLLPIGVQLRKPHGLLQFGQGGYTTADGGYYGGGYAGGTAGYPGGYGQPGTGTTSAGPATTRAASAARRPGSGCGPAWAPAASARGADRPQILRYPAGRTGLDLRAHPEQWRRSLIGARLVAARRPVAGEAIRKATTKAAGSHSGGDPAIRSSRSG